MSIVLTDSTVRENIYEACYAVNSCIKCDVMNRLEGFESLNGYIPALIKVIDVRTDASPLPIDCRHLASILLKNVVLKNWNGAKTTENQISEDEKQNLRNFLSSYYSEPECKIEKQLCAVTSKIASLELPNGWNELIPSILSAIQLPDDPLRTMRALFRLVDLMAELKSKCVCCQFRGFYNNLNAKLFPSISKFWALQFKKIRTFLSTVDLESSTAVPKILQLFPSRNLEVEMDLFLFTTCIKYFRIVLENTLEEILKLTSCFDGFWKSYLVSIQFLSGFIRKSRPLFLHLVQNSGVEEEQLSDFEVGFKIDVLLEEEPACVGDYFIPVRLIQGKKRGFFSLLNFVLSGLKYIVCAPVYVQKAHPLQIVKFLPCMLQFYHSHLLTEYQDIKLGQVDLVSSVVEGVSIDGCMMKPVLHLKWVTISALSFLSNVLSCSTYDDFNLYKKEKNLDPCAELDEDEAMIKDIISAANKLKNEFFNPTRVTELMELLLFPLLAFDTAELQEWQEEPEEFFIGQQSLSEVSNVKTVAEGLFCGLLDIAPEVVGPIIAQLLQDKNRQLNSTVALALTGAEFDFKQQQVQKTRELFFWDGVYLCAGIGVSVISSYLDDSQAWLVNVFAPVLSHVMVPTSGRISGVANEMVKTRLIWLLQVWMYQFDQTILSHALDLLVSILSSSTCDLVCKLHAVQALDGLVNLEQFEHANVVGYALPAVEALCSIVRQLNESENKIMALSLVSELFRLLSIQIQIEPLIEPLAEFLSSLWLSCPPSDPVRRTILEVLRELVGAAGPLSPTLHPIILPIITYSCGAPTSTSSTAVSQHGMDHSSKEKESLDRGYPGFLLREGLSLWLAVMRQLPATFCSPQLDLLFSAGLQPLLRRPGPDCGALDPAAAVNDCVLFYEENSADLVRDVLLIVEAYALFTGRFLIQDVSARKTLMVFFSLLIGNTDPGTTPFIARSLSALLMACPNEAGLFLLETGLLHKILKILFSSVRCPHFCTLFAPYKESDISIVSYVTVIARLMLQNPVCLLNAVTVSKNEVLSYLLETTGSATCNLTEVVIMTELVYLLIDKFPHLKYHRGGLFYRRLFCCALLSLFPCPGPNEIRNNPPSGFGLSGSGGKPCKVQETAKKLLGLVSSKSMLSPPRAVPNPALDFQWLNVFSLQQLCGLLGPITSVIRTVVQEEETGEGKTGPGSGQPVLLPGADRAARTRIVRQLKELISCSAEVCDFDSDEEEDEGVMGEVGFKSSSSGEEEGRMGGRQGFDMQEILAGESLDPLSLFFCEGMCRDEVLLTSLQQKFSAKLLKLKFLVGDEVFSSLETTLN